MSFSIALPGFGALIQANPFSRRAAERTAENVDFPPPPRTLPSVSVVIVSRGRPDQLALCLASIAMQDHPAMEVVVVADPAGVEVRPDLTARRITFDEANISVARNLGIEAAAGEIVAFIDDDAVAEPTWASRLAGAFVEADVIAAGGYTRGPHGRSWQFRAEAITADGPETLPAPGQDRATRLYRPDQGTTLGLLGTNCAFRADVVRMVGGFDPAFAYHLDESDLVMRLAARFPQAATALVPAAEVTHCTAPSARRDGARVPRDLAQIGRSEAIFAARHGGDLALIEPRYRARMMRHMVAGRLDPMGVAPLMDSLRAGIAAGLAALAPIPAALPVPAASDILPLTQAAGGETRPAVTITGPWRRRRALRREAAQAVAQGAAVTVLLLLPGILPHRMSLTPGGWWEQSGGAQGPSLPQDPPVLPMSYSTRIRREARLIAIRRNRNRHIAVGCSADQSRA